jgi:hypothetical protein
MTAFALGLGSLVITAEAPAQGDTKGKVTLETTAIALGVGVTWGDGTLVYRGKQYKFTIKGLDVGDLGVSKVSAKGEVVDLKKVEDFEGKYAAAAAGGAAGRGAGTAALVNQNGVKMTLMATGEGVRWVVASAGVEIKLKK